MKCPYCSYLESKVIDSRPAEEGTSIRRRRECLSSRNGLQPMRSWSEFR